MTLNAGSSVRVSNVSLTTQDSTIPIFAIDVVGRLAVSACSQDGIRTAKNLGTLERMVNAAIGAVCDVLEAMPGDQSVLRAAHDLQDAVYGHLLDRVPPKCLGWLPSMFQLAASIIAADIGWSMNWADRRWSGWAGVLLACCGSRIDVADAFAYGLGRVAETRPGIMRPLAEAIASHALHVAEEAPATTHVEQLRRGLTHVGFGVLVTLSVVAAPLLHRELACTRAAETYVALARLQLGRRSSTCQHSLNSALCIASLHFSDDRIDALINAGILELFARLHLGGNAGHAGPIGRPAVSWPAELSGSPGAGCAANIAELAKRPRLRATVQDRLHMLLGPMLVSLHKHARDHDYGARSRVW